MTQLLSANGAVAIWMLVTVPIGQYPGLSTSSSTGLIVVAAAGSLWWFRRSMPRAGMHVRLDHRLLGHGAPATT